MSEKAMASIKCKETLGGRGSSPEPAEQLTAFPRPHSWWERYWLPHLQEHRPALGLRTSPVSAP